MVDRVGQQLGNYRLIRLLGKGGFAEVYLGEHVYLKTPGAIKLLQTKLGNEEDLDSFLKEAQTIAQLVHPHIVRVLEFGLDGETPYLVMDYAPNGTLRQRYPKGTQLPLTTIVPYVKQVAEALQYAHEEKFIHRDVKPENILVGRRDVILLSDFGIALIAQSSRYQSTQEVIGTAAYMSPEQIQGKPRPASDQYSLGIVVYEWLSGNRPFHGSFAELCTQHMFAPPTPLREKVPTLSPAVEQVVLTALSKDPKQRFGSVQAFANAFEQASQVAPGQIILPDRPPQPKDAIPSPNQPQRPTKFPPSSSQPQRQSFIAEPTKPTAVPAAARVNLVPLGLGAFAVTLFVLSAFNVGFFPMTIITSLPLLFTGGGLLQIIAGVQEFRTGNTFGATAFCSYGGFWLAVGVILTPAFAVLTVYTGAGLGTALGFFLLGWTIFTALMLFTTLRSNTRTLRSNILLIVGFSALLLTFLLLTIGAFAGAGGITVLGSYLGILTALIIALLTWYTATHRTEAAAVPTGTTGNPIPLGLSAFALTTFVLSSANAGLISAPNIVLGLALFYGGFVQIIAGVQAFRTGNTFGATAFCSYGGFWLAVGVIFIPAFAVLTAYKPATLGPALGFFLLSWTIFTLVMALGILRSNVALIIVFLLLFVTFLLLTIGAFAGAAGITVLGGWLGILTALAAWYTATRRCEIAAVPVAATANPIPLGLSAFALTLFVLSSANAGLISAPNIVLGLALFYGGFVQIIAGVQAFRTGNTFATTAFCVNGVFWLVLGAIFIPGTGILAAFSSNFTALRTFFGIFLLGWTIFNGLMFLGALRLNGALIGVFVLLSLTFLLLTIGAFAGAAGITQLGGWLGILTALVAWYTALAGVLAETRGPFVLPVGRRG